MFSIFGYRSLKAELFCIAVLAVVLTVLLICEYRQRKLMEKAEDSEEPCTEPENIYRA